MKTRLLLSLACCLHFLSAIASLPPSATISYVNASLCNNSGEQVVVLTGSTGGAFSASPAGLAIDPVSGTIFPESSQAGIYAITYTIAASGPDPAFSTTTTVQILPQPNAGIDGSTTVCETSMAAINLFALISGEQAGGTWTRTVGSGGTFNAIAGVFTPGIGATTSVFTYTVDSASCSNDSSTAMVTLNAQPSAGVSGSINICVGSEGSINLFDLITDEQGGGIWTRTSGTGGSFDAIAGTFAPMDANVSSTFTYTVAGAVPCINDTSTATVNIFPMGMPVFTDVIVCQGGPAPLLPMVSTNGYTGTWSPVVIDTSTLGTTIYTFTPEPNQCAMTATVTVTVVQAPTASFVNLALTVCQGMNFPMMIQGTPNSTVAYNQNSGANQTVVLDSSGMAVITNIAEVSTTFCLTAVHVGSCSTILSQCANVAVVPMPNLPIITTADDNHNVYVEGSEIVQPLLLSTYESPNYTYEWTLDGVLIAGATASTFTATLPGLYTVRVTGFGGCTAVSAEFQVFQIPVPPPVGNPSQNFTQGQTLADIVIAGSNIQWYDGLGRNITANPLPLTTPLVNGMTYYASQTINGHESPDRLAVTVSVTLATIGFNGIDLQFGPNPVSCQLYLKSSQILSEVAIVNLVGQQVFSQLMDQKELTIDMSAYQPGTYFVKARSQDKQQYFKVIKN
jgi:hypothetical protein